jgi:hypothetical protein
LSGNRTSAFLGDVARRMECRVSVVVLSSFSGGWGVYVTGSGECAVLAASIPARGQPAGLWAREHRVLLSAAQAQALLSRCVDVDVAAVSLVGLRPFLPDEPCIGLTLWNPDGATVSFEKPAGVEVPAVDAVVRAASRLTRKTRGLPCTHDMHEGPLRGLWRPWRDDAAPQPRKGP